MLLNAATGETVLDGTETHIVFNLEALTWIESNLDAAPMELIARGRASRLSVEQVKIMLWAGMEAYRRRTGGSGGQVNPERALKVMEAAGMFKVAPQVIDAFVRCPGLGLDIPAPEEGETVDPTTAGTSSDASSTPEFSPPTPGS